MHIIAQALATDPEGLGEYFGREQVDYLKIVPSHLRALNAGRGLVLPGRAVVIGGEGGEGGMGEGVDEGQGRVQGDEPLRAYGGYGGGADADGR